MNLLTATSKTQGARASDFCLAIEGELVWVREVCRKDRDDADGPCGCGRAFAGLNSHEATTTAEIRDLPLDRGDVVVALRGYRESAGLQRIPLYLLEPEVDEVLAWLDRWPPGTIVERRLDDVLPRS
jgi:hypothetical protein